MTCSCVGSEENGQTGSQNTSNLKGDGLHWLSPKHRKLRLLPSSLTKIGPKKMLPDLTCLLQRSAGQVRICRKQHEGLAPFCLVALVQAGGGGIMVWGVIVSLFNACPFMTTVDHILMVNSSRMMHHVTKVLWKHALRSKVRSSFTITTNSSP